MHRVKFRLGKKQSKYNTYRTAGRVEQLVILRQAVLCKDQRPTTIRFTENVQ